MKENLKNLRTKTPSTEKMEKSEFLMPLLLDSFQRERSEDEKWFDGVACEPLKL